MPSIFELDELEVHRVFEVEPERFEALLGIRLKKDTVVHHFPLKAGGHVDFFFKDLRDNHFLVEVKLGHKPLDVLPQLQGHELKDYLTENPEIRPDQVQTALIVDKDSIDEQDERILMRMSIHYGKYNPEEIRGELLKISAGSDAGQAPLEVEFPDLDDLRRGVDSIEAFTKQYSDLRVILRGCKYYPDFEDYWSWKHPRKEPTPHDKWRQWRNSLHAMLLRGQTEDVFWLTYLEAITDNYLAAKKIFEDGWTWEKVRSTDIGEFKRYAAAEQSKGRMPLLTKITKRDISDLVFSYVSRVGSSQDRYFRELIVNSKSPFDAYDMIVESMDALPRVGPWISSAFATWLAELRALPIIPSGLIRISERHVSKVIDELKLRRGRESDQDVVLRIAGRYRVAPYLVERGLFYIHKESGRETEEIS
jgi:hypothetical protein